MTENDDQDRPPGPRVELMVYTFGPGAEFEGRLIGALERIESGGALRVVDVLFVLRDPDSGQLAAIELEGRSAGGLVAPLLGFRLDPGERRRATRRALGDGPDDPRAAAVRALGETLAPGAAVVAALVEHVWAGALEDAVARIGGRRVAGRLVDGRTLAELAPDVLAAARGEQAG